MRLIISFDREEAKLVSNQEDKGISIKIVTDKTQRKSKSSLVPAFIHDGFDVRIKKKYRIEHNKFEIFGGKTLITDRYNWTKNATGNNAENYFV